MIWGTTTFLTVLKIGLQNGGTASYYIVIAQTDPEKGHKGINALIVERGMEGFEVGAKEDKLGIRRFRHSHSYVHRRKGSQDK